MKYLISAFLMTLLISQGSLSAQTLDERIDAILSQMTSDEKIYQLINNTFFTTGDNTRLGIPGFQMSDGPHGVRFGGATVFPVGIAMAASWDVDLVERVGYAMGEEFWAHGKHQQLGPCLDLCRDPRNGRSPETAGEDPYLAGQLAASVIRGIQKTPVLATAKHFNLVNRQQYRHNSNITISERWLMEHYGDDFRMAVQEGGVLSVMNAYNLINGTYCSANDHLLQTILRDRWGFPFYIVSDWGAVHNSERAIESGTDICMGSDHYENDLGNLLQSGSITEEVLDKAVGNVLRTKLLAGMLDNYPRAPEGLVNSPEHQELALEAARKVLVLLKNEGGILPLDSEAGLRIALIGPSADKAQLDGFGSSWVEPIYSISPHQGIANIIGSANVKYVKGCDINSTSTAGFAAARQAALEADIVIFVGGLDDTQEGEGYGDRPEYDRAGGSVQLPGKQQDLINELASVNENLVVVIKSGGICALNDCIDNIKGLIYAFYPGQEGGNAIAEAIFGLYNPGGKLPVTMPRTDGQMPPWNDNFNDDSGCGYRWYDENGIDPQFVFGHGLSFTEFTYANLQVLSPSFADGEPIRLSADISNTGGVAGEEVAQLYLSYPDAGVWMPEKQLKGFQRVMIGARETRTVTFELTAEDFYFWDESADSYQSHTGTVIARLGGSSGDLPLATELEIGEDAHRPDLKVTKVLTIPRYPKMGDRVHFLALVRNLGSEDVDPGQMLQVAFSIDQESVATAAVDDLSIPAGGMKMVEATGGQWPARDSGIFVIEAAVDPGDLIPETIETNNLYARDLYVYDSAAIQFRPNLALHKPVSATSSENGELGPENAVDGNIGTRWSSGFSDPQVFIVDLLDMYDIQQIRIQWEAAYGKSFILSVSTDQHDWQDLILEQEGDGNVDEYEVEATGRYVKYTGIERATQWGHSFYEFEVYGRAHDPNSTDTKDGSGFLEQIRFFPNPFTDRLYLAGPKPALPLNLVIFDTEGLPVLQRSVYADQWVELAGLKPGVYITRISDGNWIRTARIFKN